MGDVLPRTNEAFLTFCRDRSATWKAVAAQIGLSAVQADTFENNYDDTQEVFDAAVKARAEALAKTDAQRVAIRGLRRNAADLIRVIRAFAAQQANPNAVYQAANIPAPAAPSPAPAPGTPFEFRAELNYNGALTLRWKCENPSNTSGTVYVVYRRSVGGSFQQIGASGAKSFTDNTIPFGTDRVEYMVEAMRGETRGAPSNVFVIQFGVGGPGVTVTEQKAAA